MRGGVFPVLCDPEVLERHGEATDGTDLPEGGLPLPASTNSFAGQVWPPPEDENWSNVQDEVLQSYGRPIVQTVPLTKLRG